MSHPPSEISRQHGWLSDFQFSNGRVRVRKTDINLAVDEKLIAEIWAWIPYLAVLWLRAVWATLARLVRGDRRMIWYAPDRPRPWYLVRGAALWAGIGVARHRADADIEFYFDDVTAGEAPLGGEALNVRCTDVSKSHVAETFEAVFGYPLRVDPTTYHGPVVEKSEKNGVHDGRIMGSGDALRSDCVYQRLIDTTDADGSANDLRTLCVGGAPVLVWLKVKPAGARFAIHNRKASLREPAEIFSREESALIGQFTARMGLDWGGLDILRDRADGRIYIVDVNKTDVGPVIALSWRDKMRSMDRLGRALEGLVASRGRVRQSRFADGPAEGPVHAS
ncbi:hypothetical protein [Brevundimonas sp. SL161]|uniref:hypothetical protein n=1 Tax=Brevundimonas sp. SL161 TaxID=2804613 RepID=UPI003CF792D5